MANPTYDYEAQKASLDRRRRIAEAMQMQSMQPLQGNNLHWTSGLAQILGAVAGQRGQARAAAEEAELGQRYRKDLASGVQSFMDTSQGQPESFSQEGFAGSPAVAANPRKAVLDAIASNHPVVQQLGMSQLAQMGKREGLSQKDILSLGGYDPRSKLAAAMAGDIGKLSPEAKEHVVGGQIVRQGEGGRYGSVGDFREQFSPVGEVAQGPSGPIFGQRDLATGKVAFAPGGGVTVNTGDKAGVAFEKGLAGARVKALETSFEKAQAAQTSLDSLNAARQDFASGIKSGAPAEIALGLSKWGKALGFEADPAVANTEAFRSNMAQQVLSSVKALGSGTGISNADRDYAEKAAGGSITLDDQAMYRLMNIQQAAAANTIVGHKALLAKAGRSSGANPEDLAMFDVPLNVQFGDDLDWDEGTRRVIIKSRGPAASKPGRPSNAPIPGQAKPAAGGVVSWQDYLKSQGM